MEREPLKHVSPEYQLQLDGLAETLMANRCQRLASVALDDTVEMPVITQDALFEYEDGNFVRGSE